MPKLNDNNQQVLVLQETDRDWIDKATYEQMFYKYRFAPSGHKFFTGDTGIYFQLVMKKKARKMTHEELVAVSKKIGWTG